MTGRLLLTTLIAATTLVAACTKETEDRPGNSTSALDSAELAPEANVPTTGTAPTDTSAPQSIVTQLAVIATDSGDIEVELYGKDAPKTVENFVGLAGKNYYNGTAFHRVVPGFVIQAGDPLSKDTNKRAMWGQGGESFFGKKFADELDPNTASYQRGYVEGAVAMANAGPNTNGSQFFIVLSDDVATRLPHGYTLFGFVRNGMDIVHKIEHTWRGADLVHDPVRIRKVTVTEVKPTASSSDTASPATAGK